MTRLKSNISDKNYKLNHKDKNLVNMDDKIKIQYRW